MSEQITIPKEPAQRLFDALTGSMDYGSGFLESDDVQALRELAVAIGVDPRTATPDEFKGKYPHTFVGETDRQQVAWMVGALTQTVAYSTPSTPARATRTRRSSPSCSCPWSGPGSCPTSTGARRAAGPYAGRCCRCGGPTSPW